MATAACPLSCAVPIRAAGLMGVCSFVSVRVVTITVPHDTSGGGAYTSGKRHLRTTCAVLERKPERFRSAPGGNKP